MVAVANKRRIGLEDLENQTALELPDRQMMLVTIVITNVLNNLSVDIDVQNNRIAVLVCAAVDLISAELLGDILVCEIQQ